MACSIAEVSVSIGSSQSELSHGLGLYYVDLETQSPQSEIRINETPTYFQR